MANTPKYTTPGRSVLIAPPDPGRDRSPAPFDVALSPRVEALRKLVASGQYQVSPRYLAQRIMRSAPAIKPE